MADSTRYVLLLAMAAAARFLVLADFMIADLIAPSLQSSFQTSPTTLLLARNAMPITVTIGIPLAVLLVGRVGLKTIYLAALACFVLALLISAHASNLAWFVVGRVLQGCATAIVSSQVFALLLGLRSSQPAQSRDRPRGWHGSLRHDSGPDLGLARGGWTPLALNL